MADSSIVNSGQPDCYISDSSTDQCSGESEVTDDDSDGLNFCCGAGTAFILQDALNWYYSLNGAVDCEACELFKYLTTNYSYIFLAV